MSDNNTFSESIYTLFLVLGTLEMVILIAVGCIGHRQGRFKVVEDSKAARGDDADKRELKPSNLFDIFTVIGIVGGLLLALSKVTGSHAKDKVAGVGITFSIISLAVLAIDACCCRGFSQEQPPEQQRLVPVG